MRHYDNLNKALFLLTIHRVSKLLPKSDFIKKILFQGGTNDLNSDGSFKSNSAPTPTQHVHLFHRQVGVML